MTEEIDESDSNNTINVQDEVGLLGCSQLLHLKSVVKMRSCREMFKDKLLDDLHSLVRVIDLSRTKKRESK